MKIIFLLMSIITTISIADNLGIVGKTYPISEPDMIDWIKAKAAAMIQSGQWQQIQNQATANIKQQINHPTPVNGISDAQVTRSWYYQPMIQVKQDISDTHGHLIAKAGSYNALRYKPFDVQL